MKNQCLLLNLLVWFELIWWVQSVWKLRWNHTRISSGTRMEAELTNACQSLIKLSHASAVSKAERCLASIFLFICHIHSICLELGKIIFRAFFNAISRSVTKTELAISILQLVTKLFNSFMAHVYDSSTSLRKKQKNKVKSDWWLPHQFHAAKASDICLSCMYYQGGKLYLLKNFGQLFQRILG